MAVDGDDVDVDDVDVVVGNDDILVLMTMTAEQLNVCSKGRLPTSSNLSLTATTVGSRFSP